MFLSSRKRYKFFILSCGRLFAAFQRNTFRGQQDNIQQDADQAGNRDIGQAVAYARDDILANLPPHADDVFGKIFRDQGADDAAGRLPAGP